MSNSLLPHGAQHARTLKSLLQHHNSKASLLQHSAFPDSSVGEKSACNVEDSGSIPESEGSAGEGIGYPLQYPWASPVTQLVKNLPAMWETWV